MYFRKIISNIPLIGVAYSFSNSALRIIGPKFYYSIILNIFAAILEAIGIALIIPLLLVMNDASGTDKTSVYIRRIFDFLHLDYSTQLFFIFIIFIFILRSVLLIFCFWIDSEIFSKSQKNIYKKSIKSMQSLSYEYFLNHTPGHFNNIIQTESIRASLTINYYIKACNCFLMMIVFFIISLLNDFNFTIIVMFCSALSILLFKGSYTKNKRLSAKLSEENSIYQDSTLQILNNFKYLAGSNSFEKYFPYVFNKMENTITIMKTIRINSDIYRVFTQIILIILISVVIYFYVQILKEPIGGILISLILCQRGLSKAMVFQNFWQNFNNVLGSFKFYLNSISEIENKKEPMGNDILTPEPICFKIENLKFSYKDKFNLNIKSLSINKNQIVSIVGASGSGKSTLLDLLIGLHKVDEGIISVNGKDINKLNLKDFRSKIGYVLQDPCLFNDTIKNNITIWDDSPESNQKMTEASFMANIQEFIEKLPNQYGETIGDKGLKLSGGQRQRISIARELYKKPYLLILDEATSALDSESEAIVSEAIMKLKGYLTIIIVAHRLSTVKLSDKIFVLDKGSVIGEGTYDELMVNCERFKLLVNHQLIN